ncbi:MAG: sugar ABC transporter substrate-binding protein [Synergistaceae bacterium]|nr:sugar ABC transporter substrate-binding protein [Synergistaceae bacterium]
MKRTAALFLTIAFILGLAVGAFALGRKFGATYLTLNHSYFVALDKTIRAVLEFNGDMLLSLDPQRDQSQQDAQLQDLIAQGVDAIFLTPVDSKGVSESLRACKEAGIPVINVDTPVYDEALVDCIIESDNQTLGRLCAEDLLQRLWGGKIAIIKNSLAKTGIERSTKIREIVSATPGFLIVNDLDYGRGEKGTKAAVREILRKTPDVDAIMCTSDTLAMWAIDALREAGKLKDVLVYGIDGSPEGKTAVEVGELAGTAAQSPINIGQIACDMAYRILDGEAVEKHISVPVLFINADNLDKFFLNGWQ